MSNGEAVGLVPWLDAVIPCPELDDPLNGHWEGYYNPVTGDVFYEVPDHKILELKAASEYHENDEPQLDCKTLQEIPDTIGTHSILTETNKKQLSIVAVFSWRLDVEGNIQGMLINNEMIKRTPVLLGDKCLYAAQSDSKFKYFFQYRIANKIKREDPEALAAISHLMDH